MRNSRWLITFLAFCGLIICILDRSALSFAIKDIERELHLNNTQFGLLSSAFSVGYLIMVFSGGFIVDKFGSRSVWSITAIVWSVATLLLGFSTGLIMVFFLRLITGMAEGPTGPCIMKSVTDWLPLKERGRALAAIIAANPFSSVVGAPLCSFLIIRYNWKVMFFVLGILGIVWGIVWLTLYRNNPNESKFTTPEEAQYILKGKFAVNNDHANSKTHISSKFIFKSRTLLLNNYAFFAFGYLLFFALSWLPGYLMQTYHYSLKEIGGLVMLPWLAATVGMLICGFLSDWLWHKTASLKISRSYIIGICQIIAALCFIPVVKSHDIITIFTFLSLAMGFGLAPSSCLYALNTDIARERGSIGVGVMVACLAIAGIIAPIITGWLSNVSGNFDSAIYVMLLINISAGILVLLFQIPDKEVARNYGGVAR